MATVPEVLIPAFVGAATGAIATAYKSRKDLELQYDIKLREERIEAYKQLWTELERLAYYAPAETELTHGAVRELAGALRKWYFETGGLLMSEATREAYFDLQRALRSVGNAHVRAGHPLEDPTAKAVKQLGSRLRTTTTDDVATRVGPLITHSITAWLRRAGRRTPRVTVTRGWSFEPDERLEDVGEEEHGPKAVGAWRVRVVNRSLSRTRTITRVWFEAKDEIDANPVESSRELPQTLYPREAWEGFVTDERVLMADVDDPFRSGRARGPDWNARSRSGSDAPASPVPGDTQQDQSRHST